MRFGSGSIRTSLFAATDDANIPDAIASQMADMFSGDIDFHRELRKGDRFSVVFESMTADGEPITWNTTDGGPSSSGAGRLIAGEFVNNGRTYSAVWFRDAVTGKGSFYSLDGASKRRAFLASPMEFSRITSGFAMRMHPILEQLAAAQRRGLWCPTALPCAPWATAWSSRPAGTPASAMSSDPPRRWPQHGLRPPLQDRRQEGPAC